jgi:hypothetical protein
MADFNKQVNEGLRVVLKRGDKARARRGDGVGGVLFDAAEEDGARVGGGGVGEGVEVEAKRSDDGKECDVFASVGWNWKGGGDEDVERGRG